MRLRLRVHNFNFRFLLSRCYYLGDFTQDKFAFAITHNEKISPSFLISIRKNNFYIKIEREKKNYLILVISLKVNTEEYLKKKIHEENRATTSVFRLL